MKDEQTIKKELSELLLGRGVSDVGFCETGLEGERLKYAVSIAVRLSDEIVDEIGNAPTPTYFNHYRTVNSFIDRCLLEAGLYLQREGFGYITVATSQSMPGTPFNGRVSHKEIARKAGLGTIGKNSLFLHSEYGVRVRLGTVLTDCALTADRETAQSVCSGCDLCVKSCPCGAILGGEWSEGVARQEIFSPSVCSEYMKKEFKEIGRGAVCGICMRVCPAARGEKNRIKQAGV